MTGSGTPADPYIIYDATDLQNMASDLTACYELANDIDASATVGWNAGAGFIPVGDVGTNFTGSLDGKGYKITELFINDATVRGGLFGYIGVGAEVKNVGLESCDITSAYAAALADHNYGTVSNCYSTGSIVAPAAAFFKHAGGLIQRNEVGGTITDCHSECSVTAANDAGGLCARNAGTITRCYATGAVSGANDAGGLLEYNLVTGVIEESYATGNVTVTGNEGGGLVASTRGQITNCYARGDVSAPGDAGGLIATLIEGTIENCYSTGAVVGVGAGGLIEGRLDGVVTDCFWDEDTSGLAVSDGGTGKTTAEMKTLSTFTDAGWDFGAVWGMLAVCNDGYPCLIGVTPCCLVPAGGTGNPGAIELLT